MWVGELVSTVFVLHREVGNAVSRLSLKRRGNLRNWNTKTFSVSARAFLGEITSSSQFVCQTQLF